ncbi:uncharacterized protein [Euphorbia lathyris]|uniref:uncharacterized protein n=1 Tax=Euphorbia lathyris TaxID=212925 RepID=UPI0033133150
MPVFSPKTTPPPSYKVRSVSFPARSNPTIHKIQQNLNKLTSPPKTPSSETLHLQLSGLGDTYKSVQHLLQSPLTQKTLTQKVPQMLDDLIHFLDICSNTRDCILSVKQSLRQLQSSLRRTQAAGSDQFTIETDVTAYFHSRKKMKKEAAKFMSLLKIKKPQFGENDDHLLNLIQLLREGSCVVFNSILVYLSAPILKKRYKYWPPLMFSKLVSEVQGEKMNEMQKVDFAVNDLMEETECSPEKMESAQRMMEDLELSMEGFEIELEGLFRELIHTRVTLLNIVSHSIIS